MALYEVALEQSYAGQQIINKWNYQSGAIPSGALGSLLCIVGMGFAPMGDIVAFGDGTIAKDLQGGQVDDVTFVQVICKNLYSVTDFYTYAFPANTHGGNAVDEGTPPFVSIGFTTDKTRADIKRGQKRFAGIPESAIGSGGVLTSTAIAAYQTLGDDMADINAVPVEGSAVLFTPYVFGLEKHPATEDRGITYTYYETETEQLEHIARINQWTVKTTARSQTSRQYGRGA